MKTTPCPWLLDPSGVITPFPSRTLSRCGAEPARPELAKATRAARCLVGAECAIRDERERRLGGLAASVAPRQPVGDPMVITGRAMTRPSSRSLWLRLLLVVGLAGALTIASGPAAGVVGPIVSSIIGALTTPSDATPTPSIVASPTASPGETPAPSPSPSEPLSPSLSPAPSGSPAAPTTYVVQSGDTLYDIAISLGLGPDGYLQIAVLNSIAGPAYTISPGQVLQLP